MLSTDSRAAGETLATTNVDGMTVYLERTGRTSYRIRTLVTGCMMGGSIRYRTEPSARRAFDATVADLRRPTQE